MQTPNTMQLLLIIKHLKECKHTPESIIWEVSKVLEGEKSNLHDNTCCIMTTLRYNSLSKIS